MDEQKLKYSVIIPHKNRFDLLRVLLKTIPDSNEIQIIVIDDRSEPRIQDQLRELLKAQPEIELILNEGERSRGGGWARNQGIEIAQGEFIVFADSDDSFKDGAFDVLNEVTTSLPDDVDLVVFKSRSEYEDGTPSGRAGFLNYLVSQAHLLQEKDQQKVKQILSRFDPPWSKLYRGFLFQEYQIRFDEVIYSDDVMFNIRALIHARKIDISTKEIYTTLDHGSSISKSNSEEATTGWFEASLKCNIEISKHEAFDKVQSVLGGFVWESRIFGWKKMLELYRKSRKHKVPLIYPVKRYVKAVWMKAKGYDKYAIRFYVIFGWMPVTES